MGLAVELDGYAHHSGRASFRADRIRDRRLRAAGIESVRITWHDVASEAEETARDLRRMLRRAAG